MKIKSISKAVLLLALLTSTSFAACPLLLGKIIAALSTPAK